MTDKWVLEIRQLSRLCVMYFQIVLLFVDSEILLLDTGIPNQLSYGQTATTPTSVVVSDETFLNIHSLSSNWSSRNSSTYNQLNTLKSVYKGWLSGTWIYKSFDKKLV